MTAHAEPAAATVAQKANTENADREKIVSDRQVYMRYARAMGWQNAGIFLFLMMAFAVCLKFPGMLMLGRPALLSQTALTTYRPLGAMVVRGHSAR